MLALVTGAESREYNDKDTGARKTFSQLHFVVGVKIPGQDGLVGVGVQSTMVSADMAKMVQAKCPGVYELEFMPGRFKGSMDVVRCLYLGAPSDYSLGAAGLIALAKPSPLPASASGAPSR